MLYINFVYLSNFIAKHKLSRLHIYLRDAMIACRIYIYIDDKDITNIPPSVSGVHDDLKTG